VEGGGGEEIGRGAAAVQWPQQQYLPAAAVAAAGTHAGAGSGAFRQGRLCVQPARGTGGVGFVIVVVGVCVCVCVCVCESVCECMCVCVRAIAYTPVRRECLQARLLLPVNIEDGRNMQSMWVCHLRVWLWSLCKFKCMCERDKG